MSIFCIFFLFFFFLQPLKEWKKSSLALMGYMKISHGWDLAYGPSFVNPWFKETIREGLSVEITVDLGDWGVGGWRSTQETDMWAGPVRRDRGFSEQLRRQVSKCWSEHFTEAAAAKWAQRTSWKGILNVGLRSLNFMWESSVSVYGHAFPAYPAKA